MSDKSSAEDLNREAIEMRRAEHPQDCARCDRLKAELKAEIEVGKKREAAWVETLRSVIIPIVDDQADHERAKAKKGAGK